MTESVVTSSNFQHLVFRNPVAADTDRGSGRLHVYLEGDGLPWVLRYFRMRNPTPRRALMLELMGQDAEPAVYIGRPCYNGFSQSAACDVSLWTFGRYSPSVVESMSVVLTNEIQLRGATDVSLFGHSGGGTLALLLAENIPEVRRVVTLAGNLDVDAWIAHHGYSPLYTSLNPAARAPLKKSIEQIHFIGDSDSNIPPNLNSDWINRQWNSYGVILKGVTHGCCWPTLWPRILASLVAGNPYRFPGKVFKKPLLPKVLN